MEIMEILLSDNNDNNQNNDNDDNDDNDTQSTVSISSYSSDEDENNNFEQFDNFDQFELNNDNDTLTLTNYIDKNMLLIPEIYNKYLHGKTCQSDPNIEGQLLVLHTFYIKPTYKMNEFFKYVNHLTKFYKNYYRIKFTDLRLPHNIIKNYDHIISHPNYLNLEIGKIYYLSGGECVCVVKTFWIKIVQRAWKKIFSKRKDILKLRHRPDALIYRKICGRWPDNCDFMPSVRGMLFA